MTDKWHGCDFYILFRWPKNDPISSFLLSAEIEYALTQTNTLIACPKTLLLLASGGVDETASSRPDDASPPKKPAALAAQSSSRKLTSPGMNGSDGASAAGNSISLTLKPIGPGVYPTRLLLTSPVDVRVIDLELTSQASCCQQIQTP